MRMIAVFEKSLRLRHIGHLDIQRFVQRGLRRSGLPVAYSNGFNPHILVSFASALSTGACGKREIMDVKLAGPVTEETFLAEMNRAMPPEMPLLEARAVEDNHPAPMAMLKAASWDIVLQDADQAQKLTAAIPGMLAKEAIPAVRKTKSGMTQVDIKPMIYALSGTGNHLYCTLSLTPEATCRPNMLVDALAVEAGIVSEAGSGEHAPAAGAEAESDFSPGSDCPEAKSDFSPGSDCPEAKTAPARRKPGAEATNSFGMRMESAIAADGREGAVSMLITRTRLLGEDAQGVLTPLERL